MTPLLPRGTTRAGAHQRHAAGLAGKLLDAGKIYKVAGWAPVAEEAAKAGNPGLA